MRSRLLAARPLACGLVAPAASGAGARPPACPVAAFRPLAGFCGARRARGRRVPRSVPRALFGFPAPLRRLVKPASPRQPGGGFAAGLGVPSPFHPRAGGGRPCPRPSLCSRLRLRASRCAPPGGGVPPGLPSAPALPPLGAPLRLALGRLGLAAPAARLRPRRCRGRPRLPWGASLFPRVAARCARPALRAPCPLRRAAAATSLAARLPARRRGRRRLFWRFRRAAFSAGSARGDTRAAGAAAAALVPVGGSVRPPTFHRGLASPFSPVIKGKKTRPRQPIHQLGKTTRRYKYLLDTTKIKQKILLFCLIFPAGKNTSPRRTFSAPDEKNKIAFLFIFGAAYPLRLAPALAFSKYSILSRLSTPN